MAKVWTENEIDGVRGRIEALASDLASDRVTFLGTKPKNGGAWTGAGITELRNIQKHLASNPPSNLGVSDAVAQKYRDAVARVGEVMTG